MANDLPIFIFNYQCRECHHRFQSAKPLDELYGLLMMKSKTGGMAYVNVLEDPVMKEYQDFFDDIIKGQPLKLDSEDDKNAFQAIFSVTCDPAPDGSEYHIGFPFCPRCGSNIMYSFEAVQPLQPWPEDIQPVTHKKWNQLSLVEKKTKIEQGISAYINQLLYLENKNIIGQDFSGKNLITFRAKNCHFQNCRFENMKIDAMWFGRGELQSIYTDCSFDHSDFRFAMGNVRFVRCSFRKAKLESHIFFDEEFIDCTFSGKLKKITFDGTPFPHADPEKRTRKKNEFHGNDFREAELIECEFRKGIDLSQQKLPMGEPYLYIPDAADCLRQLKDELRSVDLEEIRKKIEQDKYTNSLIEDEKLKYEIEQWIKLHEYSVSDYGQKQFFLRTDELTSDTSVLKPMGALFKKIAASQAHLK